MTPVLGNATLSLGVLADAKAGTLAGAKIDLYKNNVEFNPATVVLTDLVVCTYAGYAQGTLTWDVPSVADDGTPEVHSNRISWRPTDGVTPNDVYGYFIRSAAGDLIAGGSFEGGPLPMHSALDVILTSVVYRMPPGQEGYVSVIS